MSVIEKLASLKKDFIKTAFMGTVLASAMTSPEIAYSQDPGARLDTRLICSPAHSGTRYSHIDLVISLYTPNPTFGTSWIFMDNIETGETFVLGDVNFDLTFQTLSIHNHPEYNLPAQLQPETWYGLRAVRAGFNDNELIAKTEFITPECEIGPLPPSYRLYD